MAARERKFHNSIPYRGSGLGEGKKQGVPTYPPEAEMKYPTMPAGPETHSGLYNMASPPSFS